MSKRKLLKTQNSPGKVESFLFILMFWDLFNLGWKYYFIFYSCLGESPKPGHKTHDSPANALGNASYGAEVHVRRKDQKTHNLTETNYTTITANKQGAKPKDFEIDSLKSGMVYDSKDTGIINRIPHGSQKRTHAVLGACSKVTDDSIFNTDRTTNVTLRKHSRELFVEGFESGKTDQSSFKPFLIKEPPVRDDSQSDWSLTSNGSNFVNNVHLMSSYPESGKPFLRNGPSLGALDLGRSIGENSDVTLYKEIIQPSYSKVGDRRTYKNREPIPGSEGDVLNSCPKSLFSELKVRQQDSGIDSPLALHQK